LAKEGDWWLKRGISGCGVSVAGFESRHQKSKMGDRKQRSGQHTLACQKYFKKKLANGILKEAMAQKHPFRQRMNAVSA
jgi:hypothetical protein